MFALVFLGLVASASTVAWYDPYDYNNGFKDSMDKFWDNFHRKMNDLDKKIKNVVKQSKNRESSSQIIGDEYKVTLYLTGFDKEDIVVKAKRGNLVIQAIHNIPGDPVNNYLDVRNLPDFVNENGSWTYNNGKLTIVFPIKQRENDDKTEITLPYGNDKPGENNDPDKDVLKEDLDNSDDTDK